MDNIRKASLVDVNYHLISSLFNIHDLDRIYAPHPEDYLEAEIQAISKHFATINDDNVEEILTQIENFLKATFNTINNFDDNFCMYYMMINSINMVRFLDDNFSICIWSDRFNENITGDDYLRMRNELSYKIQDILSDYDENAARALTKNGFMLVIDIAIFVRGIPFTIIQMKK